MPFSFFNTLYHPIYVEGNIIFTPIENASLYLFPGFDGDRKIRKTTFSLYMIKNT